jgi:hypothetical protein
VGKAARYLRVLFLVEFLSHISQKARDMGHPSRLFLVLP